MVAIENRFRPHPPLGKGAFSAELKTGLATPMASLRSAGWRLRSRLARDKIDQGRHA